jgi:MoaA/NifB/PqqE/SkfB family radical SAM enzyme
MDHCLQKLRNEFDIIAEIRCDYDSVESAALELYVKLQKIWQAQFDSNQRIVLILDRDFYGYDSLCGQLLQTIQIIVQDIDISNFFVTIVSSNPELQLEYDYVKQHISWDPVAFDLHVCSGTFSKIHQSTKGFDGKKQSLKKIVSVLEKLSDRQKDLLFVDPVFCMMPWVGIHVSPGNVVKPCCEYNGAAIGNTADSSIAEIWNSESLATIRRSMMSGKPVAGCESCYHKENLKRDSLRNSINRDFAHHVDLLDNTNRDGTLSTRSVLYWDVRYNNLCNMACRSCGPASSSSWYQIHNDLYPDQKRQFALVQAGTNDNDVFQQMCEHIDTVEKIYFAGGEPLIIENFYRILEMLDDRKRHDVHLCYNTNLSKLVLKDRSVLDLWQKFHKVSVGASLDAMGDRAAYLRTGTVWSEIVSNRKKILDQCAHVDFYISATTGLINALHVADFHQAWVEQGLISADDFNIQLLYEPAYLSVRNAPKKLRTKIIQRYNTHIEWLRSRDRTGRAISGFRSIVNFCKDPGSYDPALFWQEVQKLDQYHGTDLLTTFPELKDSDL